MVVGRGCGGQRQWRPAAATVWWSSRLTLQAGAWPSVLMRRLLRQRKSSNACVPTLGCHPGLRRARWRDACRLTHAHVQWTDKVREVQLQAPVGGPRML